MGCYREGVNRTRTYPVDPATPNIDRLAAGGVRFDQAITGGSWTQAAFPVILTSTYASMYGGCLGPLAPQRPSPIEALAEAGYETAGFSTSPLLSRTFGYQRGFQKFVDLIPNEKDPLLSKLKGGKRLLRSPLVHYLSASVGVRTRPARSYVSAAELTDAAGEWLKSANAPFFGWLHYMDIHWPYHFEEKLLHPREIAQAWQDLGHMYRTNWKGEETTPAQHRHYRELYAEAVRYTDAQIGRLLDILEQSGRLADTVIILVADHGEEFFERRHWGHFEVNLFDEILRVPLIMYGAGLPAGCVERGQVRTLDIMPTVLDLCACPRPDGMEGASLASLWQPGMADYRPEASISEMWRNGRHMIAVRTESFKYIWDSRHPDKPELYHLESDPDERTNVHDQYPEQAGQFQAQVDAHLLRVTAGPVGQGAAEVELDDLMIDRLRQLGYVE